MLEIARVLVSDHSISLRAPVTFLFNGGEETLLLAAHGFMQQSKWASDIGAFINLESTGPGGPGFLFQHTGRPPPNLAVTVLCLLAMGRLQAMLTSCSTLL